MKKTQYSKISAVLIIIFLLPSILFSQNFFFEKIIKENYGWTMTVVSKDINGDSMLDIVGGAYQNDTIFWWENNGNLNFSEHIVISDFGPTRVIDVHDINSDGHQDIIATAGTLDKNISWFENDGNENFTEHIVSDTFYGGHTVYSVDIDKDGDIDVLGSVWGGIRSFSWFENDGNENFTEHILDSSYASCPSIYAEDINSDSFLDIIGCSFDANTIIWWENDGNENFTKHIITSNFPMAHWVYAEDINNDGNMDVLGAAYNTGVIGWFKNDGNENFTLIPMPHNILGATAVFAADLNNDNNIDILGAAEYVNTVAWWENHGNETFTYHPIVETLSGASHVTSADLDGDLDQDVLCAARFESNIVLFENKDITEISDLHLVNYTIRGPGGSYHILPGEQGTIEIQLECDTLYSAAMDISLKASVNSASIYFIKDSCSLGNANPGDSVSNSSDLIIFEVDDTVLTSWVDVTFEIYSTPQSLTDSLTIRFLVGEVPSICIVNADPDGNYLNNYLDPLENLGQVSDVYRRWIDGPMGNLILDYDMIIYYTGDAYSAVLTNDDINDLTSFLNAGKYLFITGQNIAEDLQGNPFLSNYLHSSWVNNSSNPACDGVTGSLFNDLKIKTSGGQISNQTSRDILNPENSGEQIFQYFNSSDIAAVSYFNGGYKLVYFGFGFEAVYQQTIFASPDTVLYRILEWFSVGVEEEPGFPNPHATINLSVPSFLTGSTHINAVIPKDHTGNLYVYDMTGRKINTLAENLSEGSYNINWDRTDGNDDMLALGSYIIKLDCGNVSESRRVFIIK